MRTKKTVRFFSILLLFCLMLAASGCGIIVYTEEEVGKTTAPETNGPMTTAPAYTTATPPEGAELTDPSLLEDAKERVDKLFYMDMSDYTSLIAVATELPDTIAPSEEASFLSSAYAKRNAMISEKYGCSIYTVYGTVDAIRADLNASIKSGQLSSYYADLLMIPTSAAAQFAAEGLLLDMRSLPFYTVKTEGNAGAGSYNGKNYFDLSAATESPELVYALYFNRDIAESEGAKELYSVAADGELTFDYILAFSERIALENGQYSMTVGGKYDSPSYLGDIVAVRSGIDFVSGVSGGYPQVSYASGELDAAQTLIDLLRDISIYMPPSADAPDEGDAAVASAKTGAELFAEGNSLFHVGTLSEMKDIYNKKTAWGILPLPTLSGDAYAVTVQERAVLCVSANNTRTELTALLLGALDAASGEWIDDAFISYCAEHYIRDNDSFHMLKLILDEEIYADFSYLHYPNCKDLDTATFGAFRQALELGTPLSDSINGIVKDLNKALKKIKY